MLSTRVRWGRPDVYIGDTTNGYLKIRLSDSVKSIGAFVTVKLEDGKTISKPYVSGEGLTSDSSHTIIAGLGNQKAVEVTVTYLSGEMSIQTGAFLNQTITFKEQQ